MTNSVGLQEGDVDRLAMGAGISFGGRMFSRGIQIIIQIMLARVLGPGAYGLYALSWTVMRIALAVSPLGINNGVIRFVTPNWGHEQRKANQVTGTALLLSLMSGLFVSVCLVLATPWLAETVFHQSELIPLFRIFAVAVCPATVLLVAGSATQVTKRMQYTVIAEEISQATVNLVVLVLFLVAGWGLVGAATANLLSYLAAALVALYFVWRLFPGIVSLSILSDFSNTVRLLLLFSVPTAVTGMFITFLPWVDRLFIGYYRPIEEVGVYQAVSQLSIIFVIIVSSFNSIFMPMIADLYHQHEMGRLAELFRISTKWGLYLSLPIYVFILITAEDLLIVVFGSYYRLGYTALIILSSAQLVNVATGAVSGILMMTGRQNRWLALSGLALIVNIVLNILLVPRWGIVGAALATAVSVSLLFITGLLLVKFGLGLWPYDRRYLKGVAAAFLAAIALMGWDAMSHEMQPSMLGLVISVLVTAVIFFGTLYVLGFEPEDKMIIKMIRTRFPQA